MVVVTARTRDVAIPCPDCGTVTAKVHGYHQRMVKDVPVDDRQVVVRLRVRRLVCPALGCRRQTFREQIPGLLQRHQRRTVRLVRQISHVAQELCGRAAARLAGLLAVPVSRSTALRRLRCLPLPRLEIPRVIGVDDFALRRRQRYATIIIDAETGRRVEVLPGRDAATLESWLREHPGVEVVCRDGSATYAEAVRRALPDAVQVSDDGTCGAISVTGSCSRSARTPDAGPPSTRPVLAAFTSRPRANAGTRSTISSVKASVCSTAPAASAWP